MLRLKNNISQEVKKLGKITEKDLEKITKVLQYHGEQAVNEARMNGSYTDRTGNLRHSITYEIENKLSGEYELPLGGGEEVEKDTREGLKEADNLKRDVNLTLIAGMHYAVYVEARGYTVLSDYVPDRQEIEQDIKKVIGE